MAGSPGRRGLRPQAVQGRLDHGVGELGGERAFPVQPAIPQWPPDQFHGEVDVGVGASCPAA
ncbi:hypothetical protein DEF23_07145 [Marinitenerispora sediminis]|uniref:Uncharacterized protein n=1 Tax=Marinitenerispora sediminis TaxID=1931232 RepID=A0A368T4T6_9ACTN|nr:hypothetical protein DEF28_01175 [Marinitenerispora sediminis]RCV58372.1 hypothetical protein DEF24_13675 [Marinitenerispora sediminis]RCV59549.1 hypothetical protein DEF23_07145 [Marinitenerispora sediminis]